MGWKLGRPRKQYDVSEWANRAVASAKTKEEIAIAIGLTRRTIQNYVNNVFRASKENALRVVKYVDPTVIDIKLTDHDTGTFICIYPMKEQTSTKVDK